MSENDLNEEEILQLKTICEFLFFDQYKDNANYETFEQFFSILFIKQINESNGNFSLNEIFKEIVGPKKKYLTYTRFKSAYLKYKNKDSNNSKNFNLFFSSLKTILKLYKFPKDENSEVPFLGEEQEKIIKYTTATYKEKECITNFKIMTNSLNEIFGLNIEYDEIIKCKMYPKKMDLDVKLDINFGILDPEKLKEKKVNKILNIHDEKNIRDSIVYLFGTFDEKKLTFLGIKCRSGKTDFVGKPKGEGFLLGCYGYQFHYIKFDVDKNKGITFFQPYFIYSTRKNIFLSDGIFSKIKEEDLIYDEVEINKINDPNEIDKMITTSVIPDNYFYKNTAEKEEITNENFKDVSFYEPRKWLLDKNKIKDYLSLDSILNNYELERSKTIINKNGLQRANQINENYAQNYEKNKEIIINLGDEDIDIQTSEKNLSSIRKTSLDYEQLMDMLKYQIEEELKETCENDEEYESKKHFVEEIIKNKDDYKTRGGFYGNFDFEMLNKKLLEDIENINKPRILKTKLKGKQKENETKKEKPNEQNMGYYSQNGNFNNNVFSNAMNFFNEIYGSFDTDNSFQNIQNYMAQEENNFFNQFNNFNNNNTFFTGGFDSNFYQFNNQFNSNNNFYSPFGQRYNYYYVIPTDRNVNINNNSRRNEIPYDPKKTQIAQDNWKKITDSLKLKKGFNLFKRIGWVIRTAKIVENCNKNSAFNKRFPIKEKLKMYKFLEENKKIVDFLSNKSKDNSPKNEVNKEFEFIVDEHPEKITNLNEIKRKMDSINKYLNSNNLDRATRRKLNRLYDLYNKQKNILIEEAEKINWKEQDETQKEIDSKGFVSMEPRRGMLLAYSTRSGDIAQDMSEDAMDIGPYASALVSSLQKENLLLDDLFNEVETRVEEMTSFAQSPIHTNGIRGKWIINGKNVFVPKVAYGQQESSSDFLAFIREKAEAGDRDAQFQLGTCYEYGVSNVSRDYAMAVQWYEKAAKQKHDEALNKMGTYQFMNENYKQALKLYKSAAKAGNLNAQHNLGMMYTSDRYGVMDVPRGVKWYKSAANAGNMAAQFEMGICHYYGIGVVKNSANAIPWFEMAARQGHDEAQYMLAQCYLMGDGVFQNYKEAFKYFQMAADQNYAPAQYGLCTCYYDGLGIKQDMGNAAYWCKKAAEQGYKKAINRMQFLKSDE